MTPSSLEAKNTATSHPSNGNETLVKRRQSDLAKRRSFTDYLPYPIIVDHLLTPVQQSAAKAARQIIFDVAGCSKYLLVFRQHWPAVFFWQYRHSVIRHFCGNWSACAPIEKSIPK